MNGRTAHGGHRSARAAWSAAALPLLTATAVLVAVLAVADPAVLCVLPALVLPAMLALRRYPGETMLLQLAPQAKPRRWAAIRRPRTGRGAAAAVPRGGLLLACSLAVRPPPLGAPAR